MYRYLGIAVLLLILGVPFLSAGGVMAQPDVQADTAPMVTITVDPDGIAWQPHFSYDQAMLTVAGPGEITLQRTFPSGTLPRFEVRDRTSRALADGSYTYELRFSPLLSAEAQAALEAAAEGGDREQVVEKLRQAGELPAMPTVQGSFVIRAGAIVANTKLEPDKGPAPDDQVIADDLIVQGRECIGADCIDNENFGFDTLILKQINLRLFFDDTSTTAGFPANDWRIITNDSVSGGDNYFAIEDSTAATIPFRIRAGARANAIYVSSTGRVGLGTSTPVLNLHILYGDTPSIRLDQDASSGWTPQIWDLAGNESNFFVRDTTGGSKLPFRIQPGAPTNSLTVKNDNRVGFGTWSPEYSMELERTGEDAVFVADRTDGASAVIGASVDTVRMGAFSNHALNLVVGNLPIVTIGTAGQVTVAGPGGNTTLFLDPSGNLEIAGALTEASDARLKENFQPVDAGSVLARLMQLPIATWNYRADGQSIRHMGPTAQDFYAAFGLGDDNTHIAPLDVNGVTLAGIQELFRLFQDQEARIRQLEQENQSLQQRLDALEGKLDALLSGEE